MTSYYVGDIPAEDLVIEPARGAQLINLDPFDSVAVTLRDPAGDVVEPSGFLATIAGDQVVVEWPSESVLETAGSYTLTLTLESTSGFRETVPAVRIIAQGLDGWHTVDSAQAEWADSQEIDDAILFDLLEVAKDAVVEFAPALSEDDLPPANYRKGQLMQARNIWNSATVDSSGQFGEGTFTVRPFPLDWAIKQLLRPKRGIPVVG